MPDTKLTSAEQEKATILTATIAGTITNDQASKQLGLSIRHVQRVKAAIRKEGTGAVVHGLKGKPGNHRITTEVKQMSLKLIHEKYADFKPTFATEKLAENHNIHISYGTTRLWMMQEKLWKVRTQKQSNYRSWRPRKEYFGELQQFDGSYHYWFEHRFVDETGNPLEICLLAAIDDATGKITRAVFSANEGVGAVFAFWNAYVQTVGKPLAIYLDRFSTYKVNHKAAVDNSELITQFQRAMKTLTVHLVTAHSPEAKGRIERLFGTLQDRLVKEMRLANITTPAEGNTFLQKIFIPKFNTQFSVVPAKEGNVHKSLTMDDKKSLHHIFSIHEIRSINNDFTIQFRNTWYQLTEIQPTTVRAREKVLVAVWLDGSVHILFKERDLAYTILPEKPRRLHIKQPLILTTLKLNWKPPKNHPWRKFGFGRGGDISILK